eukprot:8044388-Pyramimonas_sp.AAC.1
MPETYSRARQRARSNGSSFPSTSAWPTRDLLRQLVRKNARCALLRRLDRLRCFELSQDSSTAT